LEHETFTELLRAVFHLTEELEKRNDLRQLPRADYEHLELDTERAYRILIYEWLQYMEYLMNEYPYLFSLALRTNPFDPNAKVEIED
jgi:plasmid maintenance system killer protein